MPRDIVLLVDLIADVFTYSVTGCMAAQLTAEFKAPTLGDAGAKNPMTGDYVAPPVVTATPIGGPATTIDDADKEPLLAVDYGATMDRDV